jgi:FkbM family methyltransferase
MRLSVNESWPYLLGVYEHAVMSYLQRVVRPGATVIDVGGHTGYHAIYLAHLVGPQGQVVVVEPVTELVDELAANFDLNGLANCRVIPVAVSATDTEIDLFVPTGQVRSTIATTDPSRAEERDHERRRVPARRLDAIAAEVGGQVDLVKIDVEGAEVPALAGASTLLGDPGCTVVLEVNEWITVESQEVLQLLRDAGRDLDVIGMRGLTAFIAATRPAPAEGG